jgi:ribose transport system substrate-binding protein
VNEPVSLDRRRFLVASSTFVLAGGILSACSTDGTGTAGPTSRPSALDEAPTAPFDPDVAAGAKPDLPRRLGFVLPAGGELFTTFDESLRQAAESVGLEYVSAQANGDSPKQFQQTTDLLARGLGGLVAIDLAPPALEPLQRDAIDRGVAVFCGPFAYSTCQLGADQYALGKASGDAAVRWIQENLGGEAEVVHFNLDRIPAIKPRSEGVREALAAGGPGITIVADVNDPQATDEGFQVANTILQRHPRATVWIGTDSVLMGTLSAVEAAGKAADSALFGTDGDTQALDAIAAGGAFKSTQAIPYAVLAYAWGRYAADWLDGKSIPLVTRIGSIEVDSRKSVEAFNAIRTSPADAFAENDGTSRYFEPLGNTSYERHGYLTVVA